MGNPKPLLCRFFSVCFLSRSSCTSCQNSPPSVSSPSVSYPVHPVHPVKALLRPFLLRLFPIPFILSIPSKLFSVRFFSVCFPSRSSCTSRQNSSPAVSSPSVSHPVHPVHPVKALLRPFLLRLSPILSIPSKLFSFRFFSVCSPVEKTLPPFSFSRPPRTLLPTTMLMKPNRRRVFTRSR